MIAPLHYYGDPAQYDYDTHRFGFPKGDLSIVREKSAQPFGAGPYRFVSFEDGKVTLEANPYYYKGEPKIKTLVFDSNPDASGIDALLEGRVDINGGMTKKNVETVKDANGNKKLDGKVIVARTYDTLGYFYLASTRILSMWAVIRERRNPKHCARPLPRSFAFTGKK